MDKYYTYPVEAVNAVREKKGWMRDPKYFKRVVVSPSATIKMLSHGQSGVDKGIQRSQSGKPIEVMGLLLGRPDHEDSNQLIISDALPLPIEGFETRVVADDENVINYMIELGESIENTQHERFCGWYHTHPFDLDGTSHCFLSNTDITTQLAWQRMEDPHGNPWLAIVIDPLYSLAMGRPEMMAFRVYPPEYNAPSNETPDGCRVNSDKLRVEKWGSCWNRYYKLELDYYLSSMALSTLSVLRNKFLWYTALTNSDNNTDAERQAMSLKTSYVRQRLQKIYQKKQSMSADVGDITIPVSRSTESNLSSEEFHAALNAVLPRTTAAALEQVVTNNSGNSSSSNAAAGNLSNAQMLAQASIMAKSVCEEHACQLCQRLTRRALFTVDPTTNKVSLATASEGSSGQTTLMEELQQLVHRLNASSSNKA